MKILHILSQRQLTGAEAYAVTLATAQAQRGDAVYGVSDSFTLPFPGQTFLQPIGDRRWLQRLRNVCWLVRFLRRETIHVVHAHSRAAAWVAYIACKLTRTPLVATVHGLQAVHVSARWFRVLGRHIIAVCEALKAHLFQDLGYPARAIQVIPNGFSRHAWDIPPVSKSELYRVEPTVPVWLYAGRFTAQKGEVARLLLRALRLDFQLAGKLLVFLIGGTAIPNELIDQAEQLNRESGRTWVYLRSYEPEFPRWMQAADMVIGAGRIAIEGLLLGKPVIAFGEKGYWGLVTPANWEEALKTNFGDVGGPPWPSECRLAADLCRWLEEPPPALPAALTDHLRCFFDIQRVEAAVRAVYEESRAASLPPMPILCYHRVVNQPLKGRLAGLGVPVEKFAWQLSALHRWGYTPITFRDVLAYLEGTHPLPARPIILTFDDGYEDTYTLAFPLLQRYGMQAVVFAVADFERRWNFWDPDAEHAPLLSPAQMKEMAAQGIEFGSHTVSRPHLPTVDIQRCRRELVVPARGWRTS